MLAGGVFAGSLLGGGVAHAAVQWPMFEWEKRGGFFSPGVGVMEPPLLAVYGDGEAYADAVAHRYLSGPQARDLQDHAVTVLRNRANVRRLPDRDPPRDAPSDRVRVRTTDGHYLTAHLDGWGHGDEWGDFPRALHELYDHLQTLRRAVRADGEPWRPDALLLVAVHLDVEPDECGPWPGGVPVPKVGADRRYLETKYAGAKARRVRRGLPRSGEPGWPCYRTPAGAFVAANWRYSLPHEW
ncbi:hypothetical protein GCM10010532_014190 [Dactylosporangium siamense]|uniref:N-acetylmuramoyl-L-alanine amidase n=1 Tax=Dactylosporangium siamense TaxID=685454 RepID=A0A919PCE5_9ACTN|nr:hypothetical protein Dsi01nite_002210 [Dactylosporangium siamense]